MKSTKIVFGGILAVVFAAAFTACSGPTTPEPPATGGIVGNVVFSRGLDDGLRVTVRLKANGGVVDSRDVVNDQAPGGVPFEFDGVPYGTYCLYALVLGESRRMRGVTVRAGQVYTISHDIIINIGGCDCGTVPDACGCGTIPAPCGCSYGNVPGCGCDLEEGNACTGQCTDTVCNCGVTGGGCACGLSDGDACGCGAIPSPCGCSYGNVPGCGCGLEEGNACTGQCTDTVCNCGVTGGGCACGLTDDDRCDCLPNVAASIILSRDTLFFVEGADVTYYLIHAKVKPETAANQMVVWVSDNPEVVRVAASMVPRLGISGPESSVRVKAVGPGVATITATAMGGGSVELRATIAVTVSTEGIVFTRSDDGYAYAVTGFTGTSSDVVIPAVHNGLPVVAIGYRAFNNTGLTSVYIPDSVVSIGTAAFWVNEIVDVTIGNGVTYIGPFAFRANRLTCVVIPDSVTHIRFGAFEDNFLTGVVIPNNVIYIENGAFRNNLLTDLSIGNNVTYIGPSVFRDNLITSLEIPDTVTRIGARAFYGGNMITGAMVIPHSVTYIGDRAFLGNDITSITLGSNVERIDNRAFFGNRISGEVVIPDSVIFMGDNTFADNYITSVIFGNGLVTMWDNAFQDNLIVSVTFGDNNSLARIGWRVFQNNLLTEVTIPDNVTDILNYAFQGNELTDITIPAGVTINNDAAMGTHGAAFRTLYNGNGRLAGTYVFADNAWTLQP